MTITEKESNTMKMNDVIPDNLLAPCGINCMLCHHHCESTDPCQGCRGGKGHSKHCRECDILMCVGEKGFQFCIECGEFPCTRLTEFNEMYINRYGHEFLTNALYMKENGKQKLIEMLTAEWSCPDCGGVVCIHDDLCSECHKKISR